MPYRRLPNTDTARLRALKMALQKGKHTAPPQLDYDYRLLHRLELLTPNLESALKSGDQKLKQQAKISKKYREARRKAQLYVSHFIQVLNMCILREEMPAKIRKIYTLPVDSNKVPSLSKDSDLIYWADKIITGEAKRTQKGASPIFNPRIAIVKVHIDKFREMLEKYQNARTNYLKIQAKVHDLRPQVDEIILTIWNQVDENLQKLPEAKRMKAQQAYGLVFFERKDKERSEVEN